MSVYVCIGKLLAGLELQGQCICLYWVIIGWSGTTRSADLLVPPYLPEPYLKPPDPMDSAIGLGSWHQKLDAGGLVSELLFLKPKKPNPPKDHQLRPFFLDFWPHFQLVQWFLAWYTPDLVESVIFPHDLVEISTDPMSSHQILDRSGRISLDLARSRGVSVDSSDFQFHSKTTTTCWQHEPTKSLLYTGQLRVGKPPTWFWMG